MTAQLLLALILTALLAQLGVGVGVGVWRARGRLTASGPRDPAGAATPVGGAWAGWRRFRVVGRAIEDTAQTQMSFLLQPVDGQPLPAYLPGQYLTLGVACPASPGAPEARTLTRCYSLSEPPDPARYRISVKRVGPAGDAPALPPGVVSNHLHDAAPVGTEVLVRCPSGGFVLDDDPGVPAVLIAGGVGVTPFLSMVLGTRETRSGRQFHVYYGVRHGGEHAFKAALEQIAADDPAVHLTVVYSRPGPGDRLGPDFQQAGQIDIDLLKRTLPAGRLAFYVCGPPAMMATLIPALRAWGVAEADLHVEAFGPASAAAPGGPTPAPGAAAVAVEVAFARSGRTLVWDGRDGNLLDFAERHGILVESGCRAGACGACETRVLSGSVRYPKAPEFAVGPGRCLPCVGVPASPLRLEA